MYIHIYIYIYIRDTYAHAASASRGRSSRDQREYCNIYAKYIIIKRHILKHHILELPSLSRHPGVDCLRKHADAMCVVLA